MINPVAEASRFKASQPSRRQMLRFMQDWTEAARKCSRGRSYASVVGLFCASRRITLGIKTASGIRLEHASDLVAHPAEDGEFLLVGAGGVRRIVKAPVMPVHLAGEHWTRLIRIAADRDDRLHLLVEEF